VEKRVGYLHGKLDAQQAFFREQIDEWKSNTAQSQLEHENRTWKAQLELLVQQDKEKVAALHEQVATALHEHMTGWKCHVLASKLLEHDNNDENNSKNLHVTKTRSSSTKMALAEQIAESKSSEAQSEHEILTLQTEAEHSIQKTVAVLQEVFFARKSLN
jgi:hypothetical protein